MFSGRTQSKMIKDFGIKYVEETFLEAKFMQLSVENVLILSQKQEKDFLAYAFTNWKENRITHYQWIDYDYGRS